MLTLALLFACGKTPEVNHVDAASASASTGRPAGRADVSALTAVPSASGLTWYVLQPGSGAMAAAGDTVAVHYTGWLATGKKFDSSRDRGAPIKFVLGRGRVIKGWDEGVAGMLVGEQRQLHIPAELGYGSRGAGGVIPADAELVFDVELVSIDGK